jgi:small subunit ribosomal protein S20
MPIIKSAQKRMRQTEKRTARNRQRKERLKQSLRSFTAALPSGDSTKINEEFVKATRIVCRAGSKGILHRNAVNRRKSALARAANKALAEKK